MLQESSAGLVVFKMEEGKPSFLLLRYDWVMTGFGHWGFPKGNIETGESEKDAAIRESEEETGLSSFRFVDEFMERVEYFYRRRGETIHKEVVYFLAETEEEREVKLSYEHQEYKWLDFEESMKHLSFDNEQKVLRKANESIAQKFADR